MKIISNGNLQEVDINSGWLDGQGIFETIKTVNNLPYALGRHLDRAQNAALHFGIELPDRDVINSCVGKLLKAEPHSSGVLRISFADDSRWLMVHLAYEAPTEAAEIRIHPECVDGAVFKRFPYTQRIAILKDARAAGFDDALTFNESGNICEGSVTNFIAKVGEEWITPPTSDGLLPGILRQLLIENNLVKERSIHRSEVSDISSAFLLSSLRMAQSIAAIDGRALHLSHAYAEQIHALAVKYSVG